MDPSFVSGLVGAGPLGIIVLYLIMERRQDKTDRKEVDEKRLVYDQNRLDADKELAGALASLTEVIRGQAK